MKNQRKFFFIILGTLLLFNQIKAQQSEGALVNLEITSVDGNPVTPSIIINGESTLIGGTTRDSAAAVFVVTRTFFDDDWWVQNPVTRLSTHVWQGVAQLGDDRRGAGEFFEIAALASPNAHALSTGKQLKSLPATMNRSDIVLLSREKPRFEIIDLNNPPAKPPATGRTVLIRGIAPNPRVSAYVLVHPMLVPVWYVQKLPEKPNRDGTWRTTCYLGGEQQGINQFFEIVAVYPEVPNLYHRGQEITAFPGNLTHSALITVKRVR